jgi:hypothetical protein
MIPIGVSMDALTLLHEKIHVYQRYHTCEAIQIMNLTNAITGFEYPELGLRANPDTNRILFTDIRPRWKNEATHMNDIDDIRDHPFEIMAYASKNIAKV